MDSTELSDEDVIQLEATLEHFNGNHADTILLVARFGAGRADARDAEATGADVRGIDFAIRTDSGDGVARLEFPSPVTSLTGIQEQFLGTVVEARANAGERVPLTSLERELENRGTLPTHITEVVDATRVAPNLVEIVFEGGFESFRSVGGEQFLYVMVPRSDDQPVPIDHTMASQMGADPDEAPLGAYYTVRRWDPDAGRVTMWFVLHGHAHGVGGWAARCRPGERVAMWGPREGMGVRPRARSRLLVADESGLAAVAALLDELPGDATGSAVVETVDAGHVVDLPDRPGVNVIWLFRNGDEPGIRNRLLDAVIDLELDPDGLVAFGAAESRQITAIRKYLRHERGMSAQDVYMTGYWRR